MSAVPTHLRYPSRIHTLRQEAQQTLELIASEGVSGKHNTPARQPRAQERGIEPATQLEVS